jgi:hypothetical protein
MDVFRCVRELLANGEVDDEAKARLKKTVVSSIPDLIKIDGSEIAALVLQEFSEEHENVLEKLSPFPELQYQVSFFFFFSSIFSFQASEQTINLSVLTIYNSI